MRKSWFFARIRNGHFADVCWKGKWGMVAKYAAGLSISQICSWDMPLWRQRFIHMMAYIAKCLCLMLCCLFFCCYLCFVSTWLSVSSARSGRQLGRPSRCRRPAGPPTCEMLRLINRRQFCRNNVKPQYSWCWRQWSALSTVYAYLLDLSKLTFLHRVKIQEPSISFNLASLS